MGDQDFGHDAMHLGFYHEHIMWCGDQVSRMDIHSILDVISPEMVCGDSVFDGEGHGHQYEFVFREPLVLRLRCDSHVIPTETVSIRMRGC